MRVTVLGAGYVGVTSAALLAYLGHQVTCVDSDLRRLDRWRRGEDPLQEPGLAELLSEVDVRFAHGPGHAALADVVVVAVGTPMRDDGTPDLSQLEAAAVEIQDSAREHAVVLVRSTVPVGTCERLQNGALVHHYVVSNPEFLREGHALHDALAPSRIIAGGPDEARGVVEELYRPITSGRVGRRGNGHPAGAPFLWMSARSAELAKYAANGFLATKLSFVNEIANLAQSVDADASAVLASMGFDPRIGAQHLRPGLGWGGSCFPKDTRALQAIADGVGYDFVVLRAAIEQNTRQLCTFAEAIEKDVPRASTIALLGLAFKAGTPDTRESPALALARRLTHSGLRVSAYDPAVRELPDEPDVVVRPTLVEACARVDAIVVATEWAEFAEMDLFALRRATRGDLLFDGREVISPAKAAAAGFRYYGISGLRRDPERRTAEGQRLGPMPLDGTLPGGTLVGLRSNDAPAAQARGVHPVGPWIASQHLAVSDAEDRG